MPRVKPPPCWSTHSSWCATLPEEKRTVVEIELLELLATLYPPPKGYAVLPEQAKKR